MPKKKVLITQAIHESGVKLLEGDYEVKVADDCSVEGLKREVKDAYGIIARTALVPKEVIDAAPNLQVIGRHGVGVDNIDGRRPQLEHSRRLYTQRQRFVRCRMDVDGHRRWPKDC